MKPGELQHLMSDKHALVPALKSPNKKTNTNQHEITIDGIKYRSVNNVNIIYSVSKINTRDQLGLVDRGANGGIGGSDVRVIFKTNRKVDICGIDNHEVTNIPIATLASITKTDKGPAILSVHWERTNYLFQCPNGTLQD